MTHAITVAHTFETGHRLPHLTGKCENLHGHSWRAEVTVTSDELDQGTVVEFGAFKAALREWIDVNLDHGLMLGIDDPLTDLLAPYGKVYRFVRTTGDWPTVENVAALIAARATAILATIPHARGAYVSSVAVNETAVNTATWNWSKP